MPPVQLKYVALFFILALLAYAGFQKFKPVTCSMGRPMPTAPAQAINVSAIDESKDIDRQTIVRESSELLPANEIIQTNYKAIGESGLDKEFYSSDAPLFNLNGPVNLTPMDINGANRRVNFY